MQKITTYLWFDTQAKEAAAYYVSLFNDAKIKSVMGPHDNPMGVTFQLEGQEFIALNGGPQYSFTPAISLFVHCSAQEEVDKLWNAFIAGGGTEQPCGWLTDKYGLSWQIIPDVLGKLMQDKDTEKAGRVMQAMLKMKKIIIKDLQNAYDNK